MTRPRWLFAAVVPATWVTTCYVGFYDPGDEYGLWAVASLPGLWLPVVFGVGNAGSVMWLTLAGGSCVMAALGAILDRLRSSPVVWYAVWVLSASVFCWLTLREFPSWSKALAKNGSFQAYGLSSLNMGLLFSTVVTITGTVVWRVARRIHQVVEKWCPPRRIGQ